MKRFTSIAAALALVLTLSPLSRAAQSNKESEHVRNFVQGFYDWYLHATQGVHRETPSYTAMRSRSKDFAAKLRSALLKDEAAQRKQPDEVVGLDFDPYLNSQDPYKNYKVTSVKQKDQRFWVEVEGVDAGKLKPENSIVAIVEKAHGKYRFANFSYPNQHSDLLTVLRQLEKERKGHK